MDVNADQFGAAIGRGLQQLGQGVEQAQKFHGEVAADDATNAYQSQATKLLFGDPNKQVQQPDGTMRPDTGFFGLKGDAALRARPGVEAQLDQLQQNGSSGLPSPESRLQFEGYTRRLRSNFGERIGQFTEQHSQVWRSGVNASSADLARQNIAANPEDPEELKHGLADLTAARVREAQAASGGDPTVMAAAAQKARAEGAATQVEALVDKNPTLAKQVLENSRTILPPDAYDRLVNRVRPMLAGDQADEALRRAAAAAVPQGGAAPQPSGQPSAAVPSAPAIDDRQALDAENRIVAGKGTPADHALLTKYRQDQNTPPGQQQPSAAAAPSTPTATPSTGSGVTQADRDAAFKRSAALQSSGHVMTQGEHDQLVKDDATLQQWDQQGGKPLPAGQPAPTQPTAATAPAGPTQPTYAQWRAAVPPADRREFDRLAQIEANKTKATLPAGQQALFGRILDAANAKGTHLPGGSSAAAAPVAPSSVPMASGAPPVPTFLQGREAPPPVAANSRLAYFNQVGAKHGVSGDYLNRVFAIEGSARNPKSEAAGYFQFIPGTAAQYGITNRFDFAQTTEGAARFAADNRATMTRSIGRAPTDAELYVGHQQGASGASALLTHPSMAAADALALSAPYNGNRAKAALAISSNGGDPNAPASAFVQHWENIYNGRKGGNGPVPTFAAAGQTPYDPGSLGHAPPSLLESAPSYTPPAAYSVPVAPTSPSQVPAPPQTPQVPPAQEPTQSVPTGGAGGGGSVNLDDAAAGLPDKARALAEARALAGGDPIQARMNIAEVNRRYAEQNALTATDRAELSQSIPDYMAAASAGVSGVELPERRIWRLFPPAKARQIVDEFHANQAVGSMMRGVQFAPPQQLEEMQRDISSGQGVYSDALRTHRGAPTTGAGTIGADPDAGDITFFKRREIAARQINAEIQRRAAALVGPEADPAAYVGMAPAVRQAAAAVNPQDGSTYERYATASLGMQEFLGVPQAQQHVLTRGQAIGVANQIAESPDPKATLQQLATASGSAWPQVFRDATTLGKLPAGYQAVQTLDDPHDAALLARTLASERPGPDGKPAKPIDDTVDLMAGAKGEAAKVRDAVRFDPDVKSYAASIQKSGASADQVSGIVNAVETLALAKRSAGEASDPSSAASVAIKSFFGKFDYLPNGGARVPSKAFDAVSANAQATIEGLALDHIAVPPRFGQPGQPEPREYLDTIKAAPTWVTSPKSDAIWLMDYGGRFVRGRDGQPVSVPFSAPAPVKPAAAGDNIVPGL